MPTQNITLTRNQASNIEFTDSNITANDRAWLVVEDNGGPHFILNTANNGGSANEIEIVLSPKKYICKIKAVQTKNLPLTGVRYKLYRWTVNNTIETVYEGNVIVNSEGTAEEPAKFLSYKYILEYNELPDVNAFAEGDLIMVEGVIKIKKNGNWANVVDGGSAEGTYYRVVKANGNNPAQNGSELLNTYAEVKALAPSLDLNTKKRFTIYVPAGLYDISEDLPLDTPYIDISSLSGEMDVNITSNRVKVSVDNIKVTGLNLVEGQQFEIAGNFPNIVIKNCRGGENSFGFDVSATGTFINCEAFGYSFGYGGNASGIFINCEAGNCSFASGGNASGRFDRCKAGNDSFGSDGGQLTGTVIQCITEGEFPAPTGLGKIYASIQTNSVQPFISHSFAP